MASAALLAQAWFGVNRLPRWRQARPHRVRACREIEVLCVTGATARKLTVHFCENGRLQWGVNPWPSVRRCRFYQQRPKGLFWDGLTVHKY